MTSSSQGAYNSFRYLWWVFISSIFSFLWDLSFPGRQVVAFCIAGDLVFQAGRFITSFSGCVQQSILFGPPCPGRRLLSAPVGCESPKLWGSSNQCQVGVLLDLNSVFGQVWKQARVISLSVFTVIIYTVFKHARQLTDWMYSDLWLIPRGDGDLILGRWAEKIGDDFAQRCSPLSASLKLPSHLPIVTPSGWCHRLCLSTHIVAGGYLLAVSKVGKFRVEQVVKTFSWDSSLWAEMEPSPEKGLAGGIQNKHHMEQGTDLICSL